jgi:hypothetical protein
MYTHRTALECIKNMLEKQNVKCHCTKQAQGTGKLPGFCKYDNEQRNSIKCEEIVIR